MKNKEWMTLNGHGKNCLHAFLHAISGTDILTTQLDYLMDKELVDNTIIIKDFRYRHEIASHCLTDLGMHTAKHYFQKFENWDKNPFFIQLSEEILNHECKP